MNYRYSQSARSYMAIGSLLRLNTALCLAYLCALPAFAQQAGTPAYNQVLLPAHGVGDTRHKPMSWGSFAMSQENSWSGWAVDATSEGAARLAAIENCASRGGTSCQVVFTFANSCAAVASSDHDSFWVQGYDLPEARRRALDGCGENCEIFREGCSPSGNARSR